MATAVKHNPETTTPSLFDRPAAISLVGVVYIVGSFGIVFKLLPYFFWNVLHLDPGSAMNNVVVAMLLVAAATGLIVLGLVLLGPRAAHGTRAGIFVGVVGVLLILLLTRWASMWLEHWSFYDRVFGPTIGAILTVVIGLALLLVGGYYFLHPQFELYLQQFEDQGWFSATRFKHQQGRHIRIGTIIGILVIVIAGIYTMTVTRGTLRRLPTNWELNIPFTAKVELDPGTYDQYETWPPELQKIFRERFHINQPVTKEEILLCSAVRYPLLMFYINQQPVMKGEISSLQVDRYALRDFNVGDLGQFVKVTEQGQATRFSEGDLVPKDEFNKEVQELKKEDREVPVAVPLPPIRGTDVFAKLPLFPNIMYTLPILLLALSLWIAWRIVNYPAFADFLIATEAELNKVSWSKRKDLVKDTIVVLVTVFLMTVYLFAMDQAWSHLLSWHPIRVMQFPKENSEANKSDENKPW